ncbi:MULTISPECIES: LacI family DNA-binding transcriptional regulator [Raoultella]|jgi:DNA-binding LacI/PurR family transcriptional regulator|uniref:LacI family DNA-binding transcriptional regulator n=1 Tax=Raoultella TaxID=160674 RepID=UPI0009773F38|nr:MULTISPECIES: LacI family DNA-binding transcriptional regulator [Raoultella]MCS4269833.1 DNA-binding LacI/PurR family transcriptional regulator [Raoultella sp. BIGb0132]MCS4286793.1 DNA-binding LacI/PurR family transcriptional regulator [Raoultella terrigena]OMP97233.1 LacI family transcriptional regulator [Raoultella terrigena]
MVERIRRPVTSYDVAKLAGVSQSAVSRAFTEGGKVSATTREKIKDAAAQLGYRPSFVARSLITRRSNLIGVVVPGLMNPFYAGLVDELAQAFKEMGYSVLLFSMNSDGDTDPILEDILRHRVEALILVSTMLSSHFAEECQHNGLPVLLLNRKNVSKNVSSVTSDNLRGGEQIADFLVAGGHRQLAFIAGFDSSSTSRDREQGFTERLRRHGFPAPLRAQGLYCVETAMAATRALLNGKQRPDGIFCANDIMAIGALNVAVGEFGLVAGRDISIIGFDNIAMADWPLFNLTTYVQPIDEMVACAVRTITRQFADAASPAVQQVLTGRLIVRRSARIPAQPTLNESVAERV